MRRFLLFIIILQMTTQISSQENKITEMMGEMVERICAQRKNLNKNKAVLTINAMPYGIEKNAVGTKSVLFKEGKSVTDKEGRTYIKTNLSSGMYIEDARIIFKSKGKIALMLYVHPVVNMKKSIPEGTRRKKYTMKYFDADCYSSEIQYNPVEEEWKLIDFKERGVMPSEIGKKLNIANVYQFCRDKVHAHVISSDSIFFIEDYSTIMGYNTDDSIMQTENCVPYGAPLEKYADKASWLIGYLQLGFKKDTVTVSVSCIKSEWLKKRKVTDLLDSKYVLYYAYNDREDKWQCIRAEDNVKWDTPLATESEQLVRLPAAFSYTVDDSSMNPQTEMIPKALRNYVQVTIQRSTEQKDTTNKTVTTTFFDGLGRPYVEVRQENPNSATAPTRIFSLTEYDSLGRVEKKWFPVPDDPDGRLWSLFEEGTYWGAEYISLSSCFYHGSVHPYTECSEQRSYPLECLRQLYDDIMSPISFNHIRDCGDMSKVSIPLAELKVGPLSLPISLLYHVRGIDADQSTTSLGLGWNLVAGGYICMVEQPIVSAYRLSKVSSPDGLYYINFSYDQNHNNRLIAITSNMGDKCLFTYGTDKHAPLERVSIISHNAPAITWILEYEYNRTKETDSDTCRLYPDCRPRLTGLKRSPTKDLTHYQQYYFNYYGDGQEAVSPLNDTEDKSAHEDISVKHMLRQIVYPNRGIDEIVYEANTYSQAEDSSATTPFHAGLQIKEIHHNPGSGVAAIVKKISCQESIGNCCTFFEEQNDSGDIPIKSIRYEYPYPYRHKVADLVNGLKRDSTYEAKQSNATYDARYNLQSFMDEAGLYHVFLWDAYNRLIVHVENAAEQEVKLFLTFDAVDGAFTEQQVDAIRNISLSAKVTIYSYNEDGSVASVTGADGKTTRFDYDLYGRLSTVFDSNGTVTSSYKYHQANEY